MPCNSLRVALYAAWLSRRLEYSSNINYLSTLTYFLKENGAEHSRFALKSVLKGTRRELSDATKQAMPVLPEMLITMFSFHTLNLSHIAWRDAILCSLKGLLRKSHVIFSEAILLTGV